LIVSAPRDITILIDNSLAQNGDAAHLFDHVQALIIATTLDEVAPALHAAEQASKAGKWVAGYIAYEAAAALDEALETHSPRTDMPLVWFAICNAPQSLSPQQADDLWAGEPESDAHALTLPLDRGSYTQKIAAIQDYLTAGDAYQINFTMEADFKWNGSPKGLYRRLRQSQRTSHSAFIETADWSILSLSPELFLDCDNSTLTTKPMKGTAPRALTLADDETAATALREDGKSRAENLMIVDLLRNDLSRVTHAGSVKVDALFAVEHYPGLNTMTSTVRGTVTDDQGFASIMAALFPCGSVTGAPKARAMNIIRDLEDAPRGVYTGAIGMIEPGGSFNFNVAIRTPILFPDGVGKVGLGSGIVAESQADAEYDECRLKGRFLTDPLPVFELFETTVWHQGTGFADLQRHFARLENSARYFGFKLDIAAINAALKAAEADFNASDHYRVRFAIDRYGAVNLRTVPLGDDAFPTKGLVAIADLRTNSADLFLHHKTSHRPLYDPAMMQATQDGLIDYLFLNERNEVTEGSKTNLFIVKDGVWLTPALSCGVLPGTNRAAIMESRPVTETALTLDDLKQADEIYVANGVIGLVRVSLRDQL